MDIYILLPHNEFHDKLRFRLVITDIVVEPLSTFENIAWEVTGVSSYLNVEDLWGGEYPYTFANIKINISRYPSFYNYLCVSPALLVTLICIGGVFVATPGDRISLSVTGLLELDFLTYILHFQLVCGLIVTYARYSNTYDRFLDFHCIYARVYRG